MRAGPLDRLALPHARVFIGGFITNTVQGFEVHAAEAVSSPLPSLHHLTGRETSAVVARCDRWTCVGPNHSGGARRPRGVGRRWTRGGCATNASARAGGASPRVRSPWPQIDATGVQSQCVAKCCDPQKKRTLAMNSGALPSRLIFCQCVTGQGREGGLSRHMDGMAINVRDMRHGGE